MTKKELEKLFVENDGVVEVADTLFISNYGFKYNLYSEEDEYTPIKELTVEEAIYAVENYGKVGK